MERLTALEGRVVSSLAEKQLTIPQHYPLTLNALVAACNQSSSRDPVTAYREGEVLDALESLKAKRLVRAVLPSHGRSVVRYRQVLGETLGLDAPQLALLAVLELRGPQTVAELRARTLRMAAIDSVDHELDLLAGREEPLVERIGRRPGQKEDRWASLLSERVPDAASGGGAHLPASAPADAPASRPLAPAMSEAAQPWCAAGGPGAEDRAQGPGVGDLRQDVEAVRAELAELRVALEALRSELDELRVSLGG